MRAADVRLELSTFAFLNVKLGRDTRAKTARARALSNPGFGVAGVDSFAGFYGVESWFPPESTPLGKKFIASNLTNLT